MTIVDHLNRESFTIEAVQPMRGNEVVSFLEHLACDRNRYGSIRAGYDPKFTPKVLDQWAYSNVVTLDFSRT